MQVFIRDGRHVVVEAEADSTVAALKAAYMQRAYGTGLYDALVSFGVCLILHQRRSAAWP
jgi:hypothetical protein